MFPKLDQPFDASLSNLHTGNVPISSNNAEQAVKLLKSEEQRKMEARAYALGKTKSEAPTNAKAHQDSPIIQNINHPNCVSMFPNNKTHEVNSMNTQHEKKYERKSNTLGINQSQTIQAEVEDMKMNHSTSMLSSGSSNLKIIDNIPVTNYSTSEEERMNKARAYAFGSCPKPKKSSKGYKTNNMRDKFIPQRNWTPNYSPYPLYYPNPYNFFYPFLNQSVPYPWAPQPNAKMSHSATPNNFFNQFPIPKLQYLNHVAPAKPIHPIQKRLLLTKTPMDKPSPWAKTHAFYEKIIYIKKPIGGSFGLTVEYKTRSALVPRKMPLNVTESQSTKKPRRKRTPFGVVLVTQIMKQEEYSSEIEEDSRIKIDDIILSIQGVHVGEKEFSEACKLFASASFPVRDDKWRVCEIRVARPKQKSSTRVKREKKAKHNTNPAQPKQIMVPFVMNPNANSIISGDFSVEETNAVIAGVQRAHAMKLIRKSQFDYEDIWDVIKTLPICQNIFAKRTNSDLMKKWNYEISEFDTIVKSRAEKYWKEKWLLENARGSNTVTNFEYLSDSMRSQLRLSHRPPRGCKCGSLDHDRVNYPHCVLYRNLKQQIIAEIGNEMFEEAISNQDSSLEAQKKNKKDTETSDLILQRIREAKSKRIKLEHEADEKEALYVEFLEKVQVKNGMAIFSPAHLSIMVISAVAELSKHIVEPTSDTHLVQNISQEEDTNGPKQDFQNIGNNDELSDSDSDNDDDNMLLVSLKSKETREQKEETQTILNVMNASFKKEQSEKNMVTLVDVLVYISQTWGHVFEEPSHLEYSW